MHHTSCERAAHEIVLETDENLLSAFEFSHAEKEGPGPQRYYSEKKDRAKNATLARF